ncbi:MAG: sulfotransferase family 2 domain-containing protein [Pseudomonadota bacterium]
MVLVSHRYRFVYLKTHKTASTSVEVMLEPLCLPEGTVTARSHRRDAEITEAGIVGVRGGPRRGVEERVWRNHAPAATVRRALGRARFCDYLKIAAIRNPWDRAVSAFSSDLTGGERSRLGRQPFDAATEQFRAWLRTATLDQNLAQLTASGRPCIDALLVFERLEADVAALFARLSAMPTGALPRLKGDRRLFPERPFQDWYDARARARVARANWYEIALAGYDFDMPAPREEPLPWPHHAWLDRPLLRWHLQWRAPPGGARLTP